MGRAYEFRRGRREKRWDWMSKAFTKFGREISMAVKAGGPDPDLNAKLRAVIQNAKTANMPKDRIENAIKKASSKEEGNFEEMVYEGYAPYGVAILVETATDNPTRTVAMVRMHFTRNEGTLGKTGSLDFLFERKGVFKIKADGLDKDELELELIDFGADEVEQVDNEIYVYTPFQDFGRMQKALEEKKINVMSSELQRFPTSTVEVTPEQEEEILEIIDKFEQEDDVTAVYHNMKDVS
jgi:YebC/PmpR family DNA-binding regulatory protein